MKNKIQSLSPADAGLSLVASAPTGSVRDGNKWPCISYQVVINNAQGKAVWAGPFHIGVGHVKPMSYDEQGPFWSKSKIQLSDAEANLSHAWKLRPYATFSNPEVQASLAAKLAVFQKVTPKLDNVVHSILSDGSAYFDAQRFEDWAADYGLDADSIKAKETFDACGEIGREISRSLPADTLAGLREWSQNY